MSSVPSKHPKKKRRLDTSQEPQPGPSSGEAAQPVKHYYTREERVFRNSAELANQRKRQKRPPPRYIKASEIFDVVYSDSSSLDSTSSSTSSSSEDEDEQAKRSSKHRYREMPLSSSLKQSLLERYGSTQSSRYLKTVDFLQRIHEPVIPSTTSSSSTEDEDLQETNSSKCPLEKLNPVTGSESLPNNHLSPGSSQVAETSEASSSSVLPKNEDPVGGQCSVSNENVLSGSKSNSDVKTSKKKKITVDKVMIKTDLPILKSKSKKFDREAAMQYLKEAKRSLRKLRKLRNPSSAKKPKVLRSPGWDKKDEDLLETLNDNEQIFKCYQDRYGLVENLKEEDTGVDYFSNLPAHIIELILCTVPILDFMHCRQVCKQWRDIIDNPAFMKWKKLYYKYKKDHENKEHHHSIMKKFASPLNHLAVDDCISTMVCHMGKEFNRVHSKDMYDRLLQNPHGELADHVLKERFPKWIKKDSRVWCQMAIAVLICETVWDILKLYQTLLNAKSQCLRTDIHDALYCFALFLIHFRFIENINCGLHYRVYYAIYVIENTIPFCQRAKLQRIKDVTEPQSSQDDGEMDVVVPLTFEQIRILKHPFDIKQKIKIIALAGSGKTTTLVHLARLYPQIKFLNLMYNNAPEPSCNLFDVDDPLLVPSMEKIPLRTANREARKKFPSNVVCKTAHAVAYEAVGRDLQHKLSAIIRPYDLIAYVSCNVGNLQIYRYGKLVLAAISHFLYSKDICIGLQHIPHLDPDDNPISHINRERILKDANSIWEKMGDSTSDVRITHDVYLKLYQLQRPKLDEEFQCIMVDEAQDCTPVILDIVMSQKIPVILAGDPHQQINSFRGAKNALQLTRATHVYSLSKSFRFGPEISYMASCVLEVSLNMMEDVLVGNTSDSNLSGVSSGQFAVIARSNTVLFNEAVRMIILRRLKAAEPRNIQPFFAGGLASYRFDQLLDIYMLKFIPKGERRMKDKFISQFKSLQDLFNYAKHSDDSDLKAKIDLVNQHGRDIPNYLITLKQRCVPTMQSATIVFSTAHKSKGFEFNTVALADDYIISPITGEQSQEEANILYVAITRANKCLLLPEKVTKLLYAAHEKFEYPVSSKALLRDRSDLKCVLCDSRFIPHTVLTLVRRKTVMAGGRVVKEGPLCMKCRSDPTMRPDLHMNGLIMYLDPIPDNSHRVMKALVGPLPTDPALVYDRFNEFGDADRVFVINLNIH